MYTFLVNGQSVAARRNGKLLSFLREELRLCAVKDGCSEGACGTCMVLVDGKAVKACTVALSALEGRSVITPEGLTAREQGIYAYSFAHAGAVQCGFCTPGMVMSAKGLLDRVPDPTREQVRAAIRNNLCRCTGYQKITEAILLAARLLRENLPVPDEQEGCGVGARLHRLDARDKTLGTAVYAGDLWPAGMLWGGAVRTAHARARILSVDVTQARALLGVRAVLVAADLPGRLRVGHLVKDQYVLVPEGAVTTYLGDAVALIAAESREILEQAVALVHVKYELLPGVFSPAEACAPDAPRVQEERDNLLHREVLRRGDAEAAIARSAHVVTRHYKLPPTEHAFLEPETAVALPDGDGVIVYSGDQGIYQTRRECAEACGLALSQVRVVAQMVGGGFGGKEDMSVQHHAAILALACGCPVKFTLTRAESMQLHPKRHAMELDITLACDAQGMLTGMRAAIVADTGAFASLGGPVLQRACTHAAGPYNYQDVYIEGRAYYTNNPPGGAFRGFGVTQSCFALECTLNLLAERVGISPWEIRYRNAIRPGQALPNGQLADPSTALVETLEAVKPYYDAHPEVGIACALKNSGLGVGIPDVGRCRVQVKQGRLCIYSSAACIGQGLGTILTQIAHEVTGLPAVCLCYRGPDTTLAPDAGNTTASRQTLFTGEACRRACQALAQALGKRPLAVLEGEVFQGEYKGETDPMGADKEHPVSHIAYGYATHLVELGADGTVSRVVAAHDVGRAINPLNVEGQVEGGVVMSLGYALTEHFPLCQGRPTVRFAGLGLLRAPQVPLIETKIVEKNDSELACGAKGIGEICSIPTAPAVQLAYYNRDGIFRTALPLEGTPYDRQKKSK